MTTITFRTPRNSALAALVVVSGLALLASQAGAQTVGGTAFGSYVNARGVTTQSPVATLPDTGGMAVGEAQSFGVPSTLAAQWLTAITTGAVDAPVSSSQSTSDLENVSILNGLITADNVTAIASSYRTAAAGASNADGSGFVNLVVNGVPFTSDVARNTRVSLPGVGYAILNEQTLTGGGITVNMIHVVLQSVLPGGLLGGGGLVQTGEIVVGSAASSVGY